MATDLIGENSNTFLYRDFQARNVMLDKDGNPFFIDFQGGRKGAIQYDVASFLWQASAKYPQELRNELIDEYLESASRYAKIDKQQFIEKLNLYVLFRILQVLGAYGFRGYFERKKHFVESIPPAIENLKAQLAICGQKYAYLHKILGEMAELPQFKPQVASVSKYDGQGELTVTVYSFSYKKGIPTDYMIEKIEAALVSRTRKVFRLMKAATAADMCSTAEARTTPADTNLTSLLRVSMRR